MSNLQIDIKDKVALVSGANRGIGKAIAAELLNRGAAKVYAGARKLESLAALQAEFGDKIIPLELDVTNANSIEAAAAKVENLDILVNNAGVFALGGVISPLAQSSLKENLDVNVWGVINLTNAVSKHLQKESPTVIVNLSSLAGLGNMPMAATYSVSKAAVHSVTQGMRAELAGNNALVIGVYPGPIDTDMAAAIEMDKDSPENVARNIVDGLVNGTEDIFPDIMSEQAGAFYATNPKGVEQQFAGFVAE